MSDRASNAREKTGAQRRSNVREKPPQETALNEGLIETLGPTWTYSGNPAASDKDAVRFEIQDTDIQAQLLQDAEITYALNVEAGTTTPRTQGGIFNASARCLEVLARLFAAQADRTVGSLQVTYSKQAVTYAQRAAELRVKAQGLHAPYAGGMSRSEKVARQSDQDLVQPTFSRDQFRSQYSGPRVPQFPLSNEQPP